MTKGRLEAFSDGVLAIAITLLSLTLPVPHAGGDSSLWQALGQDWPKLAAYVVSFAFIGVIWVNHHSLMNRVAIVDRTLLFINLLLLMFVAAVPWATNLFAEFLLEGGIDSHVAAAVFSTNALFMALSFNLLWWWIRKDASRLHESIDPATAKATARRYAAGIYIYAFAIVVSFISAPATLAFHGIVACYYVVDQLPRGSNTVESESADE
jgi:uncharacterized membrane protein